MVFDQPRMLTRPCLETTCPLIQTYVSSHADDGRKEPKQGPPSTAASTVPAGSATGSARPPLARAIIRTARRP